jgi:hypothetical protein
LRVLAWVGLIVTGALLREMEFDADRHEARIAGSETFAAVGTRLIVLNAARHAALSLQGRWWRSHRLVDDFPALVTTLAARVASQSEMVRELSEQAMQMTTGRLDTHPALRDRLANVAREAEPGSFESEAAATVLFDDLEGLCRAATLVEYKAELTFAFQSARLFPVTELLFEVEGDRDSTERLACFTQGCPLAACRLALSPSDVAPLDDESWQPKEDAAQSLDAIRRRILDLAPAAREAAQRLATARERHAQLGLAVALVKLNCAIDPARFGVPAVDVETVLAAHRQAAVELATSERDLAPFSEVLGDRLRAMLRLRRAPGALADAARCEVLATTLIRLDSVRRDVDSVRARLVLIFGLCQQAARQSSPPQVRQRAHEAGIETRHILKTVHDRLDGVVYPFPLPKSQAGRGPDTPTVGVYLGSFSVPMDPAGVYSRGVEILGQLQSLEQRVVATLALAVEQVETGLGLSPLTAPEPAPLSVESGNS